jgi:hypothetical protein
MMARRWGTTCQNMRPGLKVSHGKLERPKPELSQGHSRAINQLATPTFSAGNVLQSSPSGADCFLALSIGWWIAGELDTHFALG